jgi:hypothetical protein
VSNRGLRLQISQDQARGHDGPIQGSFVILDVGDNVHSQSLRPLLHRATDAGEVLGVIRQRHAGCVNVANANILVPEALEGEPATPGAERPPGRAGAAENLDF